MAQALSSILFLRASHFSLLLIPLMFQQRIFQFLFIFEVGGGGQYIVTRTIYEDHKSLEGPGFHTQGKNLIETTHSAKKPIQRQKKWGSNP
jgi:hypothetical protein